MKRLWKVLATALGATVMIVLAMVVVAIVVLLLVSNVFFELFPFPEIF